MSNLTFSKDLERNDKLVKAEKNKPMQQRYKEFADFITKNNCKTKEALNGKKK